MKKKLFNILFILFLLFLYYGKNFFYNFLNQNIDFIVLEKYESDNFCDFEYSNGIFDYEITQILYRDIYNFNSEITIFKGNDYNFKEYYPVVDEKALLGYISKTDSFSSTVMLLTNVDMNLSVSVGDSYGILKYVNKKLVITNLTDDNFNVGDYIYTSSYSKLYKGILVGVITSKVENSLETMYNVDLFANFNTIDYLVVIKDVK